MALHCFSSEPALCIFSLVVISWPSEPLPCPACSVLEGSNLGKRWLSSLPHPLRAAFLTLQPCSLWGRGSLWCQRLQCTRGPLALGTLPKQDPVVLCYVVDRAAYPIAAGKAGGTREARGRTALQAHPATCSIQWSPSQHFHRLPGPIKSLTALCLFVCVCACMRAVCATVHMWQ